MNKFAFYIIGTILLLLLSGCLFGSRQITSAQAARLQTGMTYKQVVGVLGFDGKREAVPDSVSQWKSDADGNKVTVEFLNGKVFKVDFEYGTGKSKAESSPLFAGWSRITPDMPRSDVEKILGAPHDTTPIKTDAVSYRWEMKPTGHTLIVEFKSDRLYSTNIDEWTPTVHKH